MLLRILWRKKESRKVYFGYVLEYLRWVVSGKPGKNLVGHGISLRKTSGAIVATDGSDLAVTLRKGR